MSGPQSTLDAMGVGGLMAADAAAEVGVSTKTLTRWRRAGLLHPLAYKIGELTVYVYYDEDIAEARQVRATIHPGVHADGDTSPRIS